LPTKCICVFLMTLGRKILTIYPWSAFQYNRPYTSCRLNVSTIIIGDKILLLNSLFDFLYSKYDNFFWNSKYYTLVPAFSLIFYMFHASSHHKNHSTSSCIHGKPKKHTTQWHNAGTMQARPITNRKLEKVAYWEASQFVQELLVICEFEKFNYISMQQN
jgi:hypothetical protein